MPLKFEVNSIARRSSLAYAFHFSQNSMVSLPAADRSTLAVAAAVVPLKRTEVSVSPATAPGAPSAGPPLVVAPEVPLLSVRVVPARSPMRQ